jgi:hypothetical protein
VNMSRSAKTRSTPPTSVGMMTDSSNMRSLRSDALPLTSDILSRPSLSGKQEAEGNDWYVEWRNPIAGLVPLTGDPR